MEKKILIERSKAVSPLKYTESIVTDGNSKRLGHLAGIGADLREATRNGRKYPIDLWQKVMESDDFKEGMETKTLFAETDHPSEESGRIDTSIKEVAAVLTNMEIREDEGIVFVEFDILDTPQGRIVESLVKYGCVLGVSSRGLGEEIVRDGETIIDPETYSFYGFDLVVQPAVKSARPVATESLKKRAKNVVESFKREIENAKSNEEVESIRKLAENTNLPNMELINKAIEDKLSTSNDEDNIYIEKLEAEVSKMLAENAKLKLMLKKVSESAVVNNIKAKDTTSKLESTASEMQNVKAQLVEKNTQIESLRRDKIKKEYLIAETDQKVQNESRKVINAKSNNELLEKKLSKVQEENKTLKRELNKLKKSSVSNKNFFNENLNKAQLDNDRLNEKLDKQLSVNENLRNKLAEANDIINNMKQQLRETDEELAYAKNLIQEKNSQINDIQKKNKLNENKIKNNSNNELKKANENLSNVINKYLKNKCLQENIDENVLMSSLPKNYTIEDIDKKVSEIVDRRRKFNNFPIALGEIKTGTINLSESMKASPEDLQTLTLLTGFQK